jgi:hypothetical protein
MVFAFTKKVVFDAQWMLDYNYLAKVAIGNEAWPILRQLFGTAWGLEMIWQQNMGVYWSI